MSRKSLLKALAPLGDRLKDHDDKKIIPFPLPLEILFLTGEQIETRWVVGYGPREFGRESIDFPIFERGAPDICFRLKPKKKSVSFETDYPEKVFLNNRSVLQSSLHFESTIRIAETCLLRLRFFNPSR